MKLQLDSSGGYYSSGVGFNMYEVSTGELTVVFESYFPSTPSDQYCWDSFQGVN